MTEVLPIRRRTDDERIAYIKGMRAVLNSIKLGTPLDVIEASVELAERLEENES